MVDWVFPRALYALRDAGEAEQVGSGLYRLSTAVLSSPDLVPIAIQIPRTVVRLISALTHHRLRSYPQRRREASHEDEYAA